MTTDLFSGDPAERIADLERQNAELRERVRELEADAKRWHFVRQFMFLDDVGDEEFCLGLITYEESLSERVTPAASRLYKDRREARCRAEYRGEELDQGEITVNEAIDAAMQEEDHDNQ